MQATLNKTILLTGLLLIAIGVVTNMPLLSLGQGLDGGNNASDCSIISTSTVSIGADTSTEVVSAHSKNAWVAIQQPINATNTAALNFNAAATLTSGYLLAPGSASTSPDKLVYGLNTDAPFTESVQALTNLGSTTLFVTVCRY